MHDLMCQPVSSHHGDGGLRLLTRPFGQLKARGGWDAAGQVLPLLGCPAKIAEANGKEDQRIADGFDGNGIGRPGQGVEHGDDTVAIGGEFSIASARIVGPGQRNEAGVAGAFGTDCIEPLCNRCSHGLAGERCALIAHVRCGRAIEALDPVADGGNLGGIGSLARYAVPKHVGGHLAGDHLLVERGCIRNAAADQRRVSCDRIERQDIADATVRQSSALQGPCLMTTGAVLFQDRVSVLDLRIFKVGGERDILARFRSAHVWYARCRFGSIWLLDG